MSAFFGGSLPLAIAGDLGAIFLTPTRSIGGIAPDIVVEERHEDELVITEHPVEVGASITDHAYKRPAEVTIRCMWSNASLEAFGAGGAFLESYASDIYGQLLTLQADATPMDVSTGKRLYSDMLIRTVSVTTTAESEYALEAAVRCQQVLLVTTQATTLPPQASQANPQQTASPADSAAQQQPTAAAPQNVSALASIFGHN